MKCPSLDRLFDGLIGANGANTQTLAEAHMLACASCHARADALFTPADPLVRLVGDLEPIAISPCPDLEVLACWCAGDPLLPEEASSVPLHVSACEACAFSTAQLRLELGGGLPHGAVPMARDLLTGNSPALSRAPVVAQVVGALVLVLASVIVVLPKLGRLKFPSEAPADQSRVQAPLNPAEWPLQATFEFRLRGQPETHSLTFPHYPGVQLSTAYEYNVHLTAQRTGWFLLFLKNPDNRLPPIPTDVPSTQILHLEAGQSTRFPVGSAWEPVSEKTGSYELYAVYFDDLRTAEALISELRRANGSDRVAGDLATKLDEMVVARGCASPDLPCVLTFEWEVF